MSCLSGRAHNTTGIAFARALPASGLIAASTKITSLPIAASAFCLNGIQKANTHCTTGIIRAGCSIVCSINRTHFLRVKPAENQWIEVGQMIDYTVLSNCEWEII